MALQMSVGPRRRPRQNDYKDIAIGVFGDAIAKPAWSEGKA